MCALSPATSWHWRLSHQPACRPVLGWCRLPEREVCR